MIHKFSTGPPNDHSCKVTIQLAWWFLIRRFWKFQRMRTHYGPWQPCWISNRHQKHKSGRGPSNEHFWQVWLKSVQRFQRRRFKCEKLTDGRTTDTYPWQKLTWPMASELKMRNVKSLSLSLKFLSKSVIENVFESCNCFLSVLRNLILKIKFIYIEIILEIIKFGYHKGSHIQDM